MPTPRKRRYFTRAKKAVGMPKYKLGDIIGEFKIDAYIGHTAVNPRTKQWMSKEHHWYLCECSCGNKTYRSQQELVDPRRIQQCIECR